MPPTFTYPGVYIEELPSGVHTITGVATSIAAFVGWAAQGPTNKAVLVQSWSEFAKQFGGLDSRSYLGYGVNQFFANGGHQAYIVRVVWDGSLTAASGKPAASATAANSAVGKTLSLWASSPGSWGNALRISVQVPSSNRFGLLIQQLGANNQLRTLESFSNLSVDPTDPQYAVTVIDSDSQYITFVDPANPATVPSPPTGVPSTTSTPDQLSGGADGALLTPASDGNFEVALGSDPTASANNFGTHLLDRVDIFNLLCVPGETDQTTIQNLQTYCVAKRAFYIVDAPQTATAQGLNASGPVGTVVGGNPTPGAITGSDSTNSAYYFPWVQAADPLFGNRPNLFPPCGFVAGIYAATDASTTGGVWKAPAGIDASLKSSGLQHVLTDLENGNLNTQGINCLRQFKVYGDVVWGARTLQGNDQAGSQWKYIPIRRLALFLESSLYDGTQWVVFEPNDERLWSQIRLNVGSFMQNLFLQGAFQGTTPQQAYFVKCDGENNPPASIALGVVNILVGFAPLYPAEFVVIQIQQMAGQSQS